MQVIPAVDILDGGVVRLLKGDYSSVTAYGEDPAAMVISWRDQGATLVHVVDLQGARAGAPTDGLVASMAKTGVPFQIGGGIRTVEAAAATLDAGAERVVLGSAAVWNPTILTQLVESYGSTRVVAAVDVKDGRATGEGWLDAGKDVDEVMEAVAATGVGWMLVTGIATDGTLAGPDLDLTGTAVTVAPSVGIIGSGGVGSIADLVSVAGTGAVACVVGKALYEGRFDLSDAIAAVD